MRRHEIDMTSGPFVKKLFFFALPIMGMSILQLLFNAVDVAVLGIFTSDSAVAAVGSTTAIINLLTTFFMGFSLSTNILVAKSVGAQNMEKSWRLVGTSVFISIIIGLFVGIFGFIFSKQLLLLLKCDPTVIDMASSYLRIYFLGMPVIMIYNFSASVLRAVGDTLRPLVFLIIGGVLNVGLNILFIVVFNKDVEGVAIATVASQAVSAVLSVFVLIRSDGHAHLEKTHFRPFKQELLDIIKSGLPMGFQSSMFSISNALVSSSINEWGHLVVAANTIAQQFEAIVYSSTDAFSTATMSFVAQNVGAKKHENIWKIIWRSLILTSLVGVVLGGACLFAGPFLCGIMTDDAQVIEYAMIRVGYMSRFYFFAGIMNVFGNVLRGTGKTVTAAICSLSCTCLFRIIWIKTIYAYFTTLDMLYVIYPISWALCAVAYLIVMLPILKKIKNE